MKKIINSPKMWWFRKSFLKTIHKQIKTGRRDYCCLVKSWHSWFICWKDLKEVQENIGSCHLADHVKNNYENQNCRNVWFYNKFARVSFLEECITRSYKN